MRISDWSSDVCSSDLIRRHPRQYLRPAGSDGRKRRRRDRAAARTCRDRTGSKQADGKPRRLRLLPARSRVLPQKDKRGDRRSPAAALQVNGTRPELSSEEHTSEIQSLMRISYAVFCLKNTK